MILAAWPGSRREARIALSARLGRKPQRTRAV